MSPERRSAEERREQILTTSLELFARQGLHGVTTRMIAEAAGMSEALLYRHFRSKDELYQELQRWCLRGTRGAAERLAQLPPNTATLVFAVYFAVHQIVGPAEEITPAFVGIKRIVLSSLIGDGEFCRGFLAVNFAPFVPKFVALLEAARKAGDLEGPRPRRPEVAVWLMHHAAAMAGNMYLPDPPVVDHQVGREGLIEEIARFSLRGLGLTEAAIGHHFNPSALAAATRGLLAESGLGPVSSRVSVAETSRGRARPTPKRKVNRR